MELFAFSTRKSFGWTPNATRCTPRRRRLCESEALFASSKPVHADGVF
jgi:hypothetical protein